MLTPADLARLQQLHAQATPGPWEAEARRNEDDWYQAVGPEMMNRAAAVRDADLIAAMRNALPDLLALAALGLRVQEMRKRIETYADEVIGANEPEAVNRLLRDLLAALARLDTGQER